VRPKGRPEAAAGPHLDLPGVRHGARPGRQRGPEHSRPGTQGGSKRLRRRRKTPLAVATAGETATHRSAALAAQEESPPGQGGEDVKGSRSSSRRRNQVCLGLGDASPAAGVPAPRGGDPAAHTSRVLPHPPGAGATHASLAATAAAGSMAAASTAGVTGVSVISSAAARTRATLSCGSAEALTQPTRGLEHTAAGDAAAARPGEVSWGPPLRAGVAAKVWPRGDPGIPARPAPAATASSPGAVASKRP
jgi:hypothetical protein